MTSHPSLPYRLDRTVVIRARCPAVFQFLLEDWAAWWGAGSSLDGRAGGPLTIRFPGGAEVKGAVIDVRAPEALDFTYGYVSGTPVAPGGSRVSMTLREHASGTELHLWHAFEQADVCKEHIAGWRYQLSTLASLITEREHAGAADTVDAWFGAWAEPDASRREEKLSVVTVPDVQFRDRFSLVTGIADLVPHIGAYQRFVPEVRWTRSGPVRHCQGTVLADWVLRSPDGGERGQGTSVFLLTADGRIESVTGFSTPPEGGA